MAKAHLDLEYNSHGDWCDVAIHHTWVLCNHKLQQFYHLPDVLDSSSKILEKRPKIRLCVSSVKPRHKQYYMVNSGTQRVSVMLSDGHIARLDSYYKFRELIKKVQHESQDKGYMYVWIEY